MLLGLRALTVISEGVMTLVTQTRCGVQSTEIPFIEIENESGFWKLSPVRVCTGHAARTYVRSHTGARLRDFAECTPVSVHTSVHTGERLRDLSECTPTC